MRPTVENQSDSKLGPDLLRRIKQAGAGVLAAAMLPLTGCFPTTAQGGEKPAPSASSTATPGGETTSAAPVEPVEPTPTVTETSTPEPSQSESEAIPNAITFEEAKKEFETIDSDWIAERIKEGDLRSVAQQMAFVSENARFNADGMNTYHYGAFVNGIVLPENATAEELFTAVKIFPDVAAMLQTADGTATPDRLTEPLDKKKAETVYDLAWLPAGLQGLTYGGPGLSVRTDASTLVEQLTSRANNLIPKQDTITIVKFDEGIENEAKILGITTVQYGEEDYEATILEHGTNTSLVIHVPVHPVLPPGNNSKLAKAFGSMIDNSGGYLRVPFDMGEIDEETVIKLLGGK